MAKKKKDMEGKFGFPFKKENYKLLIIGFVAIVIGFALMTGGGSEDPDVFKYEEIFSFRRITIAPIIVLAGFGFIIYAIMKPPSVKDDKPDK